MRESNLTEKQVFYQDIIDLKHRVDHSICMALNDAESDHRNYLVKGLKKEPQMIGRVFDSNHAPTDPKLWSCAYCGCDSVIFIEEDDECEERNDAKTSQYVVLDKI